MPLLCGSYTPKKVTKKETRFTKQPFLVSRTPTRMGVFKKKDFFLKPTRMVLGGKEKYVMVVVEGWGWDPVNVC